MTPIVVTKGEFAKLRGVSAGRVSQWIAEEKITGAALVGEGRYAQIDVRIATEQLRGRLDVGQRLGNGLATNLDLPEPNDSEPPLFAPARSSGPRPSRAPVDESIRAAKLEEIQRRNRQAAREELAERGVYTPTADARAAMSGLAGAMLTTFEGALADFADTLAAKFSLPHRDVLHALRIEFRQVRAKAAESARRKAAGLEPVIAHEQAALDETEQAAAAA